MSARPDQVPTKSLRYGEPLGLGWGRGGPDAPTRRGRGSPLGRNPALVGRHRPSRRPNWRSKPGVFELFPYTYKQSDVLRHVALGGEAGARPVSRLAMPTSPDRLRFRTALASLRRRPVCGRRLHDCRRTAVTWMAGAGFPPHVEGDIRGVAAAHQHGEFLPEREA